MKLTQLTLIFLTGLALNSTAVFAAESAIVSPDNSGTAAPPPLLMAAAADLELDVTMEVIGEDVTSSEEVMHVIELPVAEMRREQTRQPTGEMPAQNRIGEQTGSGGTDQHQGTSPAPAVERNQPAPEIERPATTAPSSETMMERPETGTPSPEPAMDRPETVAPSPEPIRERPAPQPVVERPDTISPSSEIVDRQKDVKESARETKNSSPTQKGK